MPGEPKNAMQCGEFDALLNEALDGTLTGPKLEAFQAHARVCAACGPLLAEADAGQRWLKSLSEVEPPANLMHNILVATTGHDSKRAAVRATTDTSWAHKLTAWLRPVFAPVLAVSRQPRFAMSFGMAFFSLSVSLSLAGVKVSDVRHVDLRPSAIKRTYYETSGRVVKYYENIRFVYEIESRVQEIKRATTPAEPGPRDDKKRDHKNTSGQPDQKQQRNYSRADREPVLASLPDALPDVWNTTTRRNS